MQGEAAVLQRNGGAGDAVRHRAEHPVAVLGAAILNVAELGEELAVAVGEERGGRGRGEVGARGDFRKENKGKKEEEKEECSFLKKRTKKLLGV